MYCRILYLENKEENLAMAHQDGKNGGCACPFITYLMATGCHDSM
jgi:hypothetical protein